MSVFDEFIDKAKDVADVAGKKTEEFVELSKLRIKASQLRNNVQDEYQKLGGAVYNMKKADYENPTLIDSVVVDIDSLLQQLGEVEQKIAELKKVVKCPCCGANNLLDSHYCNQCGCNLDPNAAK